MLQKAGLVPLGLRKVDPDKKRKRVRAAMWSLLGAAWPAINVKSQAKGTVQVQTMLAVPFLSDDFLTDDEVANVGPPSTAAKSAALIYPDEKAWRKSFASLPKKKLKSC